MSAIKATEEYSPAADPDAPAPAKAPARRKRPARAPSSPLDITRVDTNILPALPLARFDQPEPQSALALIAVDGAPSQHALDSAPEPAHTPADEPIAPVEADSVMEAPAEAAPVAEETPVAETPAEDTTSAETVVEPEPERSAPARKMPTLAVMAALTQRAEPAVTESLTDTRERADDTHTTTRLRIVRPTEPLAETERLDPAALDALQETLDAPVTPAALAIPEAPETLDAQTIAELVAALEQTGRLTAPDAAAAREEREEREPEEPAESGSQAMWWPQAARRRSAPATRPIGADRLSDDDLEITAPRPATRRPVSATAAPAAALSSATRAQVTAPRPTPIPSAPTPKEPKDVDESFARRRRAATAQWRSLTSRSPRVVALTWAAGGHAAVASVAALIAVIALLRSSAGPAALEVFGWALAFALIAGVGAAAGYLLAQTARPQWATLALLLSQAGALTWALALLGPRAALLTLAPASAALALRGVGRVSAVATALGWMALFIADEALTLTGALAPSLPLDGASAALVDVALPLVGMWLAISILVSLYSSRMRAVARVRAVEHTATQNEAQLDRLRTQVEDDADALRRALTEALRGEQPARIHAQGALSVVADAVNEVADRLVDLRYDRTERKRLESAIRRLTGVIERAWLGLSWSWPEATGTILDDLLALLRTPPPPDSPDLRDDTTPTGQVVAPHLFRGWRPTEPDHRAQQTQPIATQAPSLPSLPSLWPSEPGRASQSDPLELPPSPRWRSPDAVFGAADGQGGRDR